MRPYGPATLRLCVGAVFLAHGAQKLFSLWNGPGLAGTAAFFTSLGLPYAYPLAILVGFTEFAGGALLIVGGLTLAIILVLRRDLLLFCFDPGHARTIGLRTDLLYYLLLSLLAVTIVVSLKAVGIILVIAMLVTPGCIAYLLTDRFTWMLWIATASAVFSSLFGVYVSFFFDAASGACIVLTQAALFLAALLFAPKQGLLRRRNGTPSAAELPPLPDVSQVRV